MNRALLIAAVWGLCCSALPCLIGAQDGPADPPALVLLKNGRTIVGRVTQVENRYLVALPQGEITLRRDDVTAICRDLLDAYEKQLAAGDLRSPEHRLKTANWCIDQKLFEQARLELDTARGLDPRDRRADYVERRLQLAQTPQPASQVENKASAEPPKDIVSHEALDRLVRNLPRGTPEKFAGVVQPILISRCATSNCHGLVSNQPLRLLRPPSNKAQASRITQRNLHAVLQFVDHSQPDNSPLLKAASNPHAGSSVPLLSEAEHAHLSQLAEWISDVTAPERLDREVNQPATISLSRPSSWGQSHLNQVQRPTMQRGFVNPVRPAGFNEPIDEAGDAPRAGAKASKSESPSTVNHSDADPAAFNRRFFPDRTVDDE